MTRRVTLPESRELRPDGSALGGWWHEDPEHGRIVCDLCPRECHLKPGDRGFCFVRQNVEGEMVLTTYGRSTGFCIDPIEKKPLNHFYPGTSVLSFGTAGCNLGCKFCQNWDISKSREVERLSAVAGPDSIARAAQELGCRSVAFTYNDPVIWAEYAIDTARACHAAGLKTVAVTAGYICDSARDAFFGAMDAANVDLKAITETFYEKLVYAHLKPVLETIEWLKRETDVWLELTNLIIPDANDADDELRQMCDWILEHVGPDVPVHFSAFHPDFRLRDRGPTPPETLVRAYDIARECGIRYPYVGNVHDTGHDSTYCPQCGTVLIERDWYELYQYRIQDGCCSECHYRIAGHFEDTPGDWGRKRLPVDMSRFQISSSHTAADTRDTAAESAKVSGKEPRTVEERAETRRETRADRSETRAEKTNTVLCPQRPELTQAQEQLLHRSACEVVAARAEQRAPQLDDPALESVNETRVGGAFVTARAAGKLRGCCGTLGTEQGAWEAVRYAAGRTAGDDPRFPPIAPAELKTLNVDVTLLFNFRNVEARGESRRETVEIGRHGLIIRQGRVSGLLLPVVAEEHGLNAEGFLRMVCRKAGLPVEAWKRDDAELQTFEGRAFGGPFARPFAGLDSGAAAASVDAEPVGLSEPDLQTYTRFCRDNLQALLTGATPNYYCTSVEDATVGGAALRLHLPGPTGGDTDPAVFSQIAFKDSLPLQATLFRLIEAAAHQLQQRGVRSLDDVTLDLTVFSDTTFHGQPERVEPAALDTARRALCVREGSRFALSWAPDSNAAELLERLANALRSSDAAQREVYSFHVNSGGGGLELANVPRGQIVRDDRPPAVADMFYPGDPESLQLALDELLPAAERAPEPWPALMLPHAGYRYSGRVAGSTLSRVEIPETVIVIGPKHTPHGLDWAVSPHERWKIPGAVIESDWELAQKLVDGIPGLEFDAAAHAREHGIEVELPLIHRLAPQARVVGIVIGSGDYARCRAFGQHLARVLQTLETRPLLVISSDMNHFADDTTNRRLDEIAMTALETLDPERVLSTVRGNEISMCGVLPATIVLETLRSLGQLERSERVAYATSADAGAGRERVVGYAGMLFGPRPDESSSSTIG